MEVLLIDAGSTDGTLECLEDFEKRYDNVTLIMSGEKSYGYQVNLGIRRAQGEYVAILETDDYVRENMYELLYEKAKEHDLDFAKADYSRFSTLRSGFEMHEPVMAFSGDEAKYDKVLDPTFLDEAYKTDYLIWRGIYKTSFLRDNDIYLRETRGAAFQDIGFAMKVLSCADRAMYVKDILYCYRTDRPSASMNSGRAIYYSKDEFESLLKEWGGRLPYIKGIYLYMLQAFVGDITFLSKGYELFDAEVQPSYYMLKERIDKALKTGIICREDVSNWEYDCYKRISADLYSYLDQLAIKEGTRKELADKCRARSEGKNIIFGTGNYGKKCLNFLDHQDVDVDGFIDNSAGKDAEFANLPIMNPAEIKDLNDTTFIIASKNGAEDMRNQLEQMGVAPSDILIWF